jgi:mRNA interferase MazF
LCQITSQISGEASAVFIRTADFISGALPSDSYIRPTRIFTADKSLIIRKAGHINQLLTDKVIDNIVTVIKGD